MADPSMNVFDEKSFKTDDYVKSLVQECVGGTELQQRKQKIQSYSEVTSGSLKKHVYENYMQFIETAREISHLESEMYQLSHLLLEQRNLLSTMREEGAPDDSVQDLPDPAEVAKAKEEAQNRKAITAIKESLKGFTGNLDGRTFIHEGGLIELDPDSYRPICRTYLFLFNDLLIISKVKHDKSLEYSAQYDATKIAVINIKDLDGVKNAINLILTDGSKIFQCMSATTKTEWIEKFEVPLKINSQKKKGPAPKPPVAVERQRSMIESKSMSSDTTLSPSGDNIALLEKLAPEWLASAPEEIEALIAQRHFEDSLQLIQKCEEFLDKDKSFTNSTEIFDKIKLHKASLSNVLLNELSNSQSRSLQAALRSARRPLKLLVEMGKGRQTCSTFLKVCRTAIRNAQRQARRNNLEVSDVFFCDVAQVVCEFVRAFNNQLECHSTLVVWCNMELQYFANQLIRHYLSKGTALEHAAKVVNGVLKPCAKLTDIGLSLSYHMEGLLRTALEQIIEESRVRLIETIGRTEDVWQPYNLQTKSNLRAVLRELDGVGIDMKSQVTGDTWINLTQSTVNFCRHFLSVTESCGYFAQYETVKMASETLLNELFLAQYNIKPSETLSVDLNFVGRNKSYLVDTLLPTAIAKFEKMSGSQADVLSQLQQKLKGPPKPKPRSIYKTDVL